MKLESLDTRKFLYDPKNSNSFLLLKDKYPEFEKTGRLSDRKVIPYIILMYDKASTQLREEFPHYPQRKKEAALCAGFEMTSSKSFHKDVEEMLIGKNSNVNAMIVRYIFLFNDPDLLMYHAYMETYMRLVKDSFEVKMTDKDLKNIESLNKQIKSLSERIFYGKDETDLVKELYSQLGSGELLLRPEDMVQKVEKGEDPIDDKPYGDKYVVGDLTFKGDH